MKSFFPGLMSLLCLLAVLTACGDDDDDNDSGQSDDDSADDGVDDDLDDDSDDDSDDDADDDVDDDLDDDADDDVDDDLDDDVDDDIDDDLDDDSDDDSDDDADDDDQTLVFIHHSVGDIWINDGGLMNGLVAEGVAFYDITYGDNWYGDNTDPVHWPETFTTYYDDVLGWELDEGVIHDVVMFKSCFPNSVITADDLAAFKGYYNDILDVFEAHPETGFLAITPPPYADNGEFDADHIVNGREFAYWMINDWATGVGNVRVVDLAGYLNNDPEFTHPRDVANAPNFWLRSECEAASGDSHPTGACISAATPEAVDMAMELM